MKKSEFSGIQPMTDVELATAVAEQRRYIPALSLIPAATYHFEVKGGRGDDKNKVNIYSVPYTGNDGQQRTFQAVCLVENEEFIPISALCERAISVGGQIIVSKGFYPTAEDISACKGVLDALDAAKKGFNLTHKIGTWADGGRRRGTKPIVTPL